MGFPRPDIPSEALPQAVERGGASLVYAVGFARLRRADVLNGGALQSRNLTDSQGFSPFKTPGVDYRPPVDPWSVSTAPAPLRQREPVARVVVLFLLTLLTTTLVGSGIYFTFHTDIVGSNVSVGQALLGGFWYSASILAILGAHEFGHYFACRYYGVDASLPYFLPAPPPFIFGTFGAFIRIRQPIARKQQLFDIGIAGPIAGFVVAVPVLFMGIGLSGTIADAAVEPGGLLDLGDPLALQWAIAIVWQEIPEGHQLVLHPMALAAWFGLLATALNLFPVGQLDGGHISYAVFGRASTTITLVTVACLVGLVFVSLSWIVWTVLILAMMYVFGPRHPSTIDEDVPLDRSRLWLAAFALVMFIVCFTPTPIIF